MLCYVITRTRLGCFLWLQICPRAAAASNPAIVSRIRSLMLAEPLLQRAQYHLRLAGFIPELLTEFAPTPIYCRPARYPELMEHLLGVKTIGTRFNRHWVVARSWGRTAVTGRHILVQRVFVGAVLRRSTAADPHARSK